MTLPTYHGSTSHGPAYHGSTITAMFRGYRAHVPWLSPPYHGSTITALLTWAPCVRSSR